MLKEIGANVKLIRRSQEEIRRNVLHLNNNRPTVAEENQRPANPRISLEPVDMASENEVAVLLPIESMEDLQNVELRLCEDLFMRSMVRVKFLKTFKIAIFSLNFNFCFGFA